MKLLSVILAFAALSWTAFAGPDWRVYFSPDGGATAAIVAELDQAKNSVLVQAYSFPSAPIAKALVNACKRGVKITVILDHSQKTAKYSSADPVAQAGITTLIDAKHASAHNNVMVIDGRVLITGSFNFTKAAEENNAENLLIIRDNKLTDKYIENWKFHEAHSEVISLPSVFAATELTVTGAAAQDKVYDGLTNAVISMANATTNGVISGDDVQVSNLAGWFATPGVGTNIPVTAALTLTGADKDNYSLTQPTGLAAAITKKTLTASLVPTIGKVYDGNTVATLCPSNYTFSGLISGETCTVNQTTGVYDSKNAGTGIGVTAVLASTNFADYGNSGFDTNNYVLPGSATGIAGKINKKTLSMTVHP